MTLAVNFGLRDLIGLLVGVPLSHVEFKKEQCHVGKCDVALLNFRRYYFPMSLDYL